MGGWFMLDRQQAISASRRQVARKRATSLCRLPRACVEFACEVTGSCRSRNIEALVSLQLASRPFGQREFEVERFL
jgi:hypothetical protein